MVETCLGYSERGSLKGYVSTETSEIRLIQDSLSEPDLALAWSQVILLYETGLIFYNIQD